VLLIIASLAISKNWKKKGNIMVNYVYEQSMCIYQVIGEIHQKKKFKILNPKFK
jgi:hypothetical protein